MPATGELQQRSMEHRTDCISHAPAWVACLARGCVGSPTRKCCECPQFCCPAGRLMERGADSQEQLWSVARVMSGEEYEQASEPLASTCPTCVAVP